MFLHCSLYSNFIFNICIIYKLNTWPRDPTNFTLKSCLFGTVILIRNAGKSKFTYNCKEIAFDIKGFKSFNKDTAKKLQFLVLIRVHHLILIIQKIKFQYFGKDQLKVLMVVVVQEKKTILTLVKQIKNFAKVYITVVMGVACM